jgi:hypothetical protein
MNRNNNWLLGFKPRMIVFVQPCPEDETAMVVQPVCADRVFRIRHKMAVRKASDDKKILRWLGWIIDER